MTNHRAFTSVTDNMLPSNLQVVQHYTSNDVDLCDDDVNNDMYYVYDIRSNDDNSEIITLPVQNIPLVIVQDNNNPNANTNAELFDIWSQQQSLSKHIYLMTLTASEKDLFHMLKASNSLIILLDQVINWVQNMKVSYKDKILTIS